MTLVRAAADLVLALLSQLRDLVSLDRWGEVIDTIRRNKLRTTLTAISVAWGIFVMIVLLGMGHGLNNGIRHSFRREATNAIFIYANKTSIPYDGYGIGRHIVFDNRDFDAAQKIAGVDHISAHFRIAGGEFGGGEMKVQRGIKSNAFDVGAVHADEIYMGASEIVEGRFLDDADITHLRKSAVIGAAVRNFLFGNPAATHAGPGDVWPPIDPIGQWIVIGDVPFQVVGVFTDEGGEEAEREIWIPISTAQLAYNGQDHVHQLDLTVGNATAAQADKITKQVVAELADAHKFSPKDPQAARVFSDIEGYEKFQQFFLVISIFVLVIGCGTLAAGVVGVSNIMMIAVKERTREIGIRKALGATPLSIITLITQEAVFLTSIAGLLGLSAGVGFLQLMPHLIQTDMIRNPSVDVGVGIMAAVGLVIAGALAGYFPARAAARVNPVQTLRDQ